MARRKPKFDENSDNLPIIKKRYESATFLVDFKIFSELVSKYEEMIRDFMEENKDKKFQKIRVLTYEDILKFIYDNFEDVLPFDSEVFVGRDFFTKYFDNFRVGLQLQQSKKSGVYRIIPIVLADKVYKDKFDVYEKFI